MTSVRRFATLAAVFAALGLAEARPAHAASKKKFTDFVTAADVNASQTTTTGLTTNQALQVFLSEKAVLTNDFVNQVQARVLSTFEQFTLLNVLLADGTLNSTQYLSVVNPILADTNLVLNGLQVSFINTLNTVSVSLGLGPITTTR